MLVTEGIRRQRFERPEHRNAIHGLVRLPRCIRRLGTTSYRCLSTRVTGSRSRPTPPGSGQIREPPFDVGLTHACVIPGHRSLDHPVD